MQSILRCIINVSVGNESKGQFWNPYPRLTSVLLSGIIDYLYIMVTAGMSCSGGKEGSLCCKA